MLNEILHHVGMSCIIYSNEEMLYDLDKINHPNWLNKGPWYNTNIYSMLYGIMFEYFITHAITDRYNILCYLFEHDFKKPAYEYDESSI